MIGVNGFIHNGFGLQLTNIIITYVCLSIIEIYVGQWKICFFLFSVLMFSNFIPGFILLVCNNNIDSTYSLIQSPYCCGSFITISSIGFVLFIASKITIPVLNFRRKVLYLVAFVAIWSGCVGYDYIITYRFVEIGRICSSLSFHSLNFLFGLFCAKAICDD